MGRSPGLPPAARLPLLILGMLALVSGVLAGLSRLGVSVPAPAAQAAGLHAALMVAAFFGTVIGLERAVALGHPLWYAAPALTGLGGVATLFVSGPAGAALCLMGSAVFLAGSVRVVRRLPSLFTVTLALGAAASVLANGLWWLTGSAVRAVALWMGFLVLTIAGERLELTRMLPPRPGARRMFSGLLGALGLAAALAVTAQETRLLAAVLLAFALWLLRYDVARRNLASTGLTRFVAVCLLAGYVMLALGAAAGLFGAFDPGHPWRDGALHAVLLGFVFAMVIGHAPLVFPAVMQVKIPYHPAFYLPLAVLQLSLLVRLAGGVLKDPSIRATGALGNAAALILLIATLISRVVAGRRQGPV